MPWRYWSFLIAAVALLTVAEANWNDTSTGIDLDQLPKFHLTKIRAGWLKDGSRATFDGIRATAGESSRSVVLSAVAKTGKRWEMHLFGLDEVWRGDLDGNGTQDYVLFGAGPWFNGRTTPLFSLTILLMDSQGLPTPFLRSIYHGENGDGIKHIVDLNHDGRAEMLVSLYDEEVSDPRLGAMCSGHWTTLAYQFRGGAVGEYRGTLGGLTFPFVHNWTYRGHFCDELEQPFAAVHPPPALAAKVVVKEVVTRIRAVDPSGWLTVEPVAGCNGVRVDAVVYDTPAIRKIALPNMMEKSQVDLAEAIRSDGLPIRLTEVTRNSSNGSCSARLLWAAR